MRIVPKEKFYGYPCSYVGVGCAYEDIYKKPFDEDLSEDARNDGYLTLDGANKYLRKYIPVRKKDYYKRNERMLLCDFLQDNTEKCLVCVLGHFVYVCGQDYYSFFRNENDPVVCVWYIKEQ